MLESLRYSRKKILVVSEYVLEAKRFDEKSSDYNNSEIKKWLEINFINEAFTKEELTKIEKVYLLSKEEVEKYFKDTEDRLCSGTKHALLSGVWAQGKNKNACWWTSTKCSQDSVYNVYSNGSINNCYVNYTINGVRVACIMNEQLIK